MIGLLARIGRLSARLLLPLVLAWFLGACSSLPSPASGTDSALIVGRLILDVSGTGSASNGADGMVNTELRFGAALTIANASTGMTYELRTLAPGGTFTLANAEPGQYRVLAFWGQVETSNAWITVSTRFDSSPSFEVQPGRIANLGEVRWRFSYDLTRSVSEGSYLFGNGYPAVQEAFARTSAGSPWQQYLADSTPVTGQASAVSSVYALPPRSSGYDNRLIFP